MTYSNPYNPYMPQQYVPAYQPPQTWLPQQQVQQPVQQPAQQQVPPTVHGRTVASPGEITPQEVPMDGSMSLFPLSDGSAVIGKAWSGDGTIKTVRYVPEPAPAEAKAPTFESEVIDRLTNIEDAISTLAQPKRTTRRTKGADDAES